MIRATIALVWTGLLLLTLISAAHNLGSLS